MFMQPPGRVTRERGRLLKPSVLEQHVEPAVAIQVAHPEPMRVTLPRAARRDGRKFPRGPGIFSVRRRVSEISTVHADDLRLSVTGQIDESRRLIVDLGEHRVPDPPLLASRWIEVEVGRCVRQPVSQHIVPAVTINVVHEREKIIRRVIVLFPESALEPRQHFLRPIRLLDLKRRLRRVELVSLGEVRAFPPIRPVDDIRFPIAIEIPAGRSLAPVKFFEVLLLLPLLA